MVDHPLPERDNGLGPNFNWSICSVHFYVVYTPPKPRRKLPPSAISKLIDIPREQYLERREMQLFLSMPCMDMLSFIDLMGCIKVGVGFRIFCGFSH